MLPKPLSRVTIRFGKMIRFGTLRNTNDFEKQRRQLEKTMRPFLIEEKKSDRCLKSENYGALLPDGRKQIRNRRIKDDRTRNFRGYN